MDHVSRRRYEEKDSRTLERIPTRYRGSIVLCLTVPVSRPLVPRGEGGDDDDDDDTATTPPKPSAGSEGKIGNERVATMDRTRTIP